MDSVIVALAEQQAELSNLLNGLSEPDWRRPTRCEGWDVSDVVLHVAQTDEMAIASASGRFDEHLSEQAKGLHGVVGSVDDAAALLVEHERGLPTPELLARWSSGATRLLTVFDTMDLSSRVTWVAGSLSARTLATTRIAETWIHTGDVASALGHTLPDTGRLWFVARLAWRTLPYAFASARRSMTGPVAFQLVSPTGEEWNFVPEGVALTTIAGSASDLCNVAARRVEATATSLRGEGPDADSVLALVRTYA